MSTTVHTPGHTCDGNPSRYQYNKGCRCQDCRDAAARYERGRQWDILNGNRRHIPALGSRRRLQALVALGWDAADMAAYLGVLPEQVLQWMKSNVWVTRESAAKIEAIYAELSMRLPPTETRSQKNKVSRAKGRARRYGWAVPLAWNEGEIDDPAATPHGAGTSAVDRADTLRDIDAWGGNATDAARVIGIDRKSLQKWAAATGHAELYRRLAAREAIRGNQWTGEVA